MSKFTDRIKNVFTVDYDDYDEDYYDDYEDDDMDLEPEKPEKRNVQQRADLNVFQQEGLLQEVMTTL